MAIYKKLPLWQKYKPKIYGLGEVYEQISVERKKKRLKEKFGSGILFLCPNKKHSGRGLALEELQEKVRQQKYLILTSGFVDSPPWRSSPGKRKGLKLPLFLAKIIFYGLSFLESFWEGEENSHIVYVLGRKK
ncbi:MAG: hypothetical protein ACOZBZ_04345 [Patescibacteria group bacterium]